MDTALAKLPAKLLGSKKRLIESFYVELNLRGQKWLINCLYKLCGIELQGIKMANKLFIQTMWNRT